MGIVQHPLTLIAWSIIFLSVYTTSKGNNCDVDDGQPTVWLGDEDDAYFCEASAEHCDHFGLDFICEDPSGGSLRPCIIGTKVKCASPPAVPLTDPTPATTIRVLAYNVFELRYLYYQSGQRERTCRIPRKVFSMHPDIDVIVFNEVFMGGCFAPFNNTIETSILTIRNILDQYGFIYYTDTVGVGEPFPKIENGATFIASRWPIVKNDSRVFDIAEPYSWMAKGVVYAMINKTVAGQSVMYHVFGTHMQAFRTPNADYVRVAQATIIHDFMLEQDIGDDEPVIFGGDLNARLNTTNGDDVVDALDATLPTIIGELNVTYDHENNDVFDENNDTNWWLDYVLYSRSHIQPEAATIQVVRPRMSTPLEVCSTAVSPFPSYPNSDQCVEIKNITDLSDHYAVLGTLQYRIDFLTPTDFQTTTDSGTGYLTSNNLVVSLTFIILITKLVIDC
nr:sphingomyelinase C 2-like [Lytechinus pictus]